MHRQATLSTTGTRPPGADRWAPGPATAFHLGLSGVFWALGAAALWWALA